MIAMMSFMSFRKRLRVKPACAHTCANANSTHGCQRNTRRNGSPLGRRSGSAMKSVSCVLCTVPHTALHLDLRHPEQASLPTRDAITWRDAYSLDAFIDQAVKLQALWRSTRRLARADEAHLAAARALCGPLSMLVLVEDWCGDAIHTIPFVMRLVEANPALELRVIKRDEHEALMATHMSDAARSIPVLIAYDRDGRERGWWGPRPTPLQQWVKSEGMGLDSDARYKQIRTWYARDRAETLLREVLTLLQHADASVAPAPASA
jgi:hypothetical protein